MRLILILAICVGTKISFAQEVSSSTAPSSSVSTSSADVSSSIETPSAKTDKASFTMSFEEKQSKNWGVSLFSLGSFDQTQVGDSDKQDVFFYNYLSLNYKMNRDMRISVRPAFTLNTGGESRGRQQALKVRAEDLHFVWSIYNLLEDPQSLTFQLKLYIPTKESSIDSGMITRLRPELNYKYYFTRFSFFQYFFKPGFFLQRYTVVQSQDMNPRTGEYYLNATRRAELDHFAELVLDINKSFSVKPMVGFEEEWFNASNADGLNRPIDERHESVFKAGVGLEWRPMKSVNTTLSLQNRHQIANRRDAFAFGRPEDNQFVLLTNASLF